MGEQHMLLAAIALTVGGVLGVILFVPFVAISYRRHGRLGAGRLLVWFAALVYWWAVWAYTLLPMPAPSEIQCAGINLNPLALVTDIAGAVSRSGGRAASLATDAGVFQIVLNIALFVPLGFFVRAIGRRGVGIAALTGLALSLVIEFTQLTGVWGLYPCAYRVFDVGDMITNTSGAVLGSLVAMLILRRRDAPDAVPDPHAVRPVTRPRRLLGLACDGIGFLLCAGFASVIIQVVMLYAVTDHDVAAASRVSEPTGYAVALVVWAAVTMSTGATIGDMAVRIAYEGPRSHAWWIRLARYSGGVGVYGLLCVFAGAVPALAGLFAVVAILVTLGTSRGRGLPGLFSGQTVADSRARANHAEAHQQQE